MAIWFWCGLYGLILLKSKEQKLEKKTQKMLNQFNRADTILLTFVNNAQQD